MADLEAGGTRTRNLKHFTLEESDDFVGGWTIDSKAVFIFKNRGDHYGIVKRNPNSETEEVIVAGAPGLVLGASVSPDGKWILIRVFRIPGGLFEPPQIMRVPTAGGSPEFITTLPSWSGIFCAKSPSNLCVLVEPAKDEKQMVVTTFDPVEGRGPELMRYDIGPFPTKEGFPLFDISPDGTRFAVRRHTDGPIEILSLKGQLLKVIRTKELNLVGDMGWTPDGKGLLVCNTNKEAVEFLHVGEQGDIKVLWTSNEGNSSSCDLPASPNGHHLALNVDKKSGSNIWMIENFR